MTGKKYDIAINITLHAENDLLYKTFRSISESIKFLKTAYPKIKLLVNVSLDKPTERTIEVFKNSRKLIESLVDEFSCYYVEYGDLSDSRNNLIEKSLEKNSKYIQFFDGDDLYSRNYITELYKTALQANRPVAVYAGKLVFIQGITGLMDKAGVYSSSNAATTSTDCLYSENLWTAVIFCDARILKNLRYVQIGSPYRFEDWHMTMRILANGYDILVADKALYMYRSKLQGSLFQDTLNNNRLCIAPCKFFEPEYFRTIKHLTSDEIKLNDVDSYPIKNSLRSTLSHDGEYINIKLHKSHFMNVALYGKRMVKSLAKGLLGIGKRQAEDNESKTSAALTKKNIDRLSKIGFDKNILDEIDFLSSIEPIAARDEDWVNRVVVYFTTRPTLSREVYRKLCQVNNIEKTEGLYIISGKESTKSLKTIFDDSKKNKSTIVVTDKTVSIKELQNRFEIETIFGGNEEFDLDGYFDTDIELLLLRFIQNTHSLKKIVIANSSVGYKLIDNMAEELKKTCPLFVFSDGYEKNNREKLKDSYLLEDIYSKVDKLIVDKEDTADQLCRVNGWDKKEIQIGL